MAGSNKIETAVLTQAGLELMRRNGKILAKAHSRGRAKIYQLPNGETVRVRTSNDHVLVVAADAPDSDARITIEGTDRLLIVMPEVARSYGPVIGYLVPTEEAVSEVRRAHQRWLATKPKTSGNNKAWALWFNDRGPDVANGYHEKWAKYRLEGEVSTMPSNSNGAVDASPSSIKSAVETARANIAKVAGVQPKSVRISIDFGA